MFIAVHLKTCSEKIDKLQKLLRRKERIIKAMKTQHKRTLQKLHMLKKKVNNTKTSSFKTSISKFFDEDQLKLLTAQYKKIPKWCNATLMKALKLKFASGSSGYKELLNQGHPLPSERTLTRKMEHMKFEPGLIDEVFQFLSMKVIYFEEIDKDCALFLDEMAITSGIVFNNSTNCFLGHVTLPLDIQRRACQALVIMLAGIGSRWKQIVAYHFTDKSLSGELLSKVILNVIQRAEQLGLRVQSLLIWVLEIRECGNFLILMRVDIVKYLIFASTRVIKNEDFGFSVMFHMRLKMLKAVF